MFILQPTRNQFEKRMTNFSDIIDDFFKEGITYGPTFKMDVKETEKEFFVEAEVPGFKKEDIKIEYLENNLIVSAEKQEQQEEEKEHFIHRERHVCSMKRSIPLKDIQVDLIQAKLEDGILKINVPKQEQNKNKFVIEVK